MRSAAMPLLTLSIVLGVALALTGARRRRRRRRQPRRRRFAKKKIVFLSGPKDHGRPGRHEYEKDLRVLAKALEESPNLKGVETKVFVGKAPRDLAEFEDAAAIVIESSSDRDAKETHPLFPQEPTTDRRTYDPETLACLKQLDGLIKDEEDRRGRLPLRELGRELDRAALLPRVDGRPVGAGRVDESGGAVVDGAEERGAIRCCAA